MSIRTVKKSYKEKSNQKNKNLHQKLFPKDILKQRRL